MDVAFAEIDTIACEFGRNGYNGCKLDRIVWDWWIFSIFVFNTSKCNIIDMIMNNFERILCCGCKIDIFEWNTSNLIEFNTTYANMT